MNRYKAIAYEALIFRSFLHKSAGLPDNLPKQKPRRINITRALCKTNNVRI